MTAAAALLPQEFRVFRDIQPGEEVTITYIGVDALLLPRTARQVILEVHTIATMPMKDLLHLLHTSTYSVGGSFWVKYHHCVTGAAAGRPPLCVRMRGLQHARGGGGGQ